MRGPGQSFRKVFPLLVPLYHLAGSDRARAAGGVRGSRIKLAGETGNRALADIVAPRNAALRLIRFEVLAGLALLVRRERVLAAEFDALALASARPRAVRSKVRRRSAITEDDVACVLP